jgi:hypothetical protein
LRLSGQAVADTAPAGENSVKVIGGILDGATGFD